MSFVACQITLFPLDTLDSARIIGQVLVQMDWQGVEVITGEMSTMIRGEEGLVWTKLRQLYELAAASGRFSLQITVSNKCGCML
jgi:uncharacterized protein YqgV (UPF0045/DUF77 family)